MTWTLLEKPSRSVEDDEQMRALAHTSLWHWLQRTDCTDRNRSIGYWMLSRVYAQLGRGDDATHYALIAQRFAQNDLPFYRAYAHEALARGALVRGDRSSINQDLASARELIAAVVSERDRLLLQNDLDDIARQLSISEGKL